MVIVAVRARALPPITTFLVIKLAEMVSTPLPPLAWMLALTVLAPPTAALPNHFRLSLPSPRLNLAVEVARPTFASVVTRTSSAPELALRITLPLFTVMSTPGLTPLSDRLTVAALVPLMVRFAR
ncbi:hypothetical protein D1872_228420 [compost metagenome]